MDREERNAVLGMSARQQKQLDRHQRILKGLQTENRRILDLLINNPPDDRVHQPDFCYWRLLG
jgi:hypothetical protein